MRSSSRMLLPSIWAQVCLSLAVTAGAQDATRQSLPTPGVIRGVVTDAATGLPLKQVRVELMATPRPLQGSWRTRTDTEGRYRFDGLPPARYTVAFSKARYVALQYGQRRPSTPGRAIELKVGATEQADAALPRASAIVGRVVDDYGDPVEGAAVRVVKPGYVNGRRGFVFGTGYATTNDAGEYRIANLPPGDYYLAVSERGDGFGADAEADIGFAQTMFPAATTAAQARAIAVRAGQDVTGIDVALTPGKTATLSGLVTTADGRPAPNVAIQLASVDEVLGGIGGSTTTQADGSFSFPRLLSGLYEIHARKAALPSGEPMEGAIIPVSIDGADVRDVPVALSRGAHITGRLVVPDGEFTLLKPANVSCIAVADTFPFGLPAASGFGDDGSIDWKALIGPRIVRADDLPDFWRLASVTRGDEDIIDTPVVFKGSDDITVTITSDAASLVGRVTGDDDRPVDTYVAVLFVDDPGRWKPRSRFIRTAVPDPDMGFTLRTLPPAHYRVAAVGSLEPGQEFDPEFLDRLRPLATPIEIQPRARLSMSLKVVKP